MGNSCHGDNKSNVSQSQTLSDVNISKFYQNTKISVIYGDILLEDVEAIVNTSNQRLRMIDGMSLMLKQSAGEILEQEIDKYLSQRGKLENGTVMYTHAGELNCLYILHASLPLLASSKKNETIIIEQGIKNSLALANNELKISSIAFPLFYNRNFGLRKQEVAQLMVKCITNFINEQENNLFLKDIRIVSKDQQVLKLISKILQCQFNVKASQSTEKIKKSMFQQSQITEDFFTSYISQDVEPNNRETTGPNRNPDTSKIRQLKQSF